MGKYSKDDYEFEKNKQAILALRQGNKEKDEQPANESVWAFEIEEHRKRVRREKFMMFGSVLGILGFLMSIFLILNLYFGWLK